MRPHEALSQYREVIRAAVARYPLANPRVFGSVTTRRDTDDSDLDLLVDTLPGATLFDLGGLQVELETALGIPVDVLTPGDLPIKFRDSVVRGAMPL
jgi:predicted nucleotidyltransferase